jgi:lipopolysaccharide transport system ATP-binding protein
VGCRLAAVPSYVSILCGRPIIVADDTVIRIEGLWKRYGLALPSIVRKGLDLFSFKSGRDLKGWNANGGPWALRDISLEVKRGETLGIIGRNGAGKSTLLKLLAGVTPPTRGIVAIYGRVFPMIELNAGLHMELTGRENIRLLGAVMGLSRRAVEAKMSEIEEFCELREWFDRPVRMYSSGMLARLGFGVALNVEADILLVDEVLAVGDMNFQRKCIERIANIQRSEVTVLLVTHAVRQAERVCRRGILLDQGRICLDSEMREAASKYYGDSIRMELDSVRSKLRPTVYIDTGEIILEKLEILGASGRRTNSVETGKPMSIVIQYRIKAPIEDLVFHLGFVTPDLLRVTVFNSLDEEFTLGKDKRGVVECYIPKLPLMPGAYGLFISITRASTISLFKGENLIMFEVLNPEFNYIRRNMELFAVDVEWKFRPPEGRR